MQKPSASHRQPHAAWVGRPTTAHRREEESTATQLLGEYAAVTLLLFFGLKSIKDAWDLPSNVVKNGNKSSPELDELAEAEELVKEKEWGDRSMLAAIALAAAQSPFGVASGALARHLLATSIAIVGGAFLANYISEKLVGYLGGGLFLIFVVATFFGVF